MRIEPPIAECAFSWGKVFRLYSDHLDVDGTRYALSKLTYVRPFYQHVMGISSVRLELCFGKKKVLLRGIAAVAEAKKVIDYLTSQYPDLDHALASTGEGVCQIGPQGDATASSDEPIQQATPASEPQLASENWVEPEQQPDEPANRGELDPGFQSAGKAELEQKARPQEYNLDEDIDLQERAQAPTAKVETLNWQRFRQDQRERRQQHLQVARALREYGFDVEKLTRQLDEDLPPEIIVPVRLLPGERAYYSTDATLCGEPIGNTLRHTYPARDHGRLILTSKRLIYIGRKSQIVLDYARLSRISRLRGAVAFQAEHWYRREIFEVRRSLECIVHLEAILRRFQREQEFEALTKRYVHDEEQGEKAVVGLKVGTARLPIRSVYTAKVIDSADR
jgi:hypothetical protein